MDLLTSFSLGIWQFLADMPYHSISPRIVWKIFWMLIDPSDNSDCPTSGAHNWRERLNGLCVMYDWSL